MAANALCLGMVARPTEATAWVSSVSWPGCASSTLSGTAACTLATWAAARRRRLVTGSSRRAAWIFFFYLPAFADGCLECIRTGIVSFDFFQKDGDHPRSVGIERDQRKLDLALCCVADLTCAKPLGMQRSSHTIVTVHGRAT